MAASTSKRHIAIGVLLGVLLLILMAIILLCRKRFRKPDKNARKVHKYQELPIPTETEAEQTDPPNDVPGLPKNAEASGYCPLSEEVDMVEPKDSCTFRKGSSKKATEDESDQLEYRELLTVVWTHLDIFKQSFGSNGTNANSGELRL